MARLLPAPDLCATRWIPSSWVPAIRWPITRRFMSLNSPAPSTIRCSSMVSDNHPKMIEEFGESLINRFVSGMVVRIDPPNYATRCEILRAMTLRGGIAMNEEVVGWIARRVTQNVRELEGAVTRIAAHVK